MPEKDDLPPMGVIQEVQLTRAKPDADESYSQATARFSKNRGELDQPSPERDEFYAFCQRLHGRVDSAKLMSWWCGFPGECWREARKKGVER